jgi:hypothetical protein
MTGPSQSVAIACLLAVLAAGCSPREHRQDQAVKAGRVDYVPAKPGTLPTAEQPLPDELRNAVKETRDGPDSGGGNPPPGAPARASGDPRS